MNHCNAPTRRAFALPMVIVLSLIAGIMAAVILERQSAQTLTATREFEGYRSRHLERGVREVVGQWTDTLVGQSLDKMLDPDGHALDIQTVDGGLISIFIFDGQGSILTDPAGLSDNDRNELGGVLTELSAITSGNPDPMILRPVGPIPVSLKTASPEVLEAIVRHAGARSPRQFVDGVLRTRAAQDITESDLQTILNRAELDPPQRQLLSSLVTIHPTLVQMVIDVYDPGASEPSLRFGGRVDLGASGQSSGGMIQSLGKFLTWEELPVRDEQGNTIAAQETSR